MLLAFSVLAWLSQRALQGERAEAVAAARAGLEEDIRLALWRLDTAAATLLPQQRRLASQPPSQAVQSMNSFNSKLGKARADPAVQQQISETELQQRDNLSQARITTDDWKRIEPQLLEKIADLIPGATLEAVSPEARAGADKDTRRLASIPARLIVPEALLAPPEIPLVTPLRVALVAAWSCSVLAAVAVGFVLHRAVSLSERRAAFVSAVTHELRTPLTTFRLYADMLASGMISDPQAREEYLQTLVRESDRLGSLIENVLAYARLERRLQRSTLESVSVQSAVEAAWPSLLRRAQQSGFELAVQVEAAAGAAQWKMDPLVLSQILLNLVDNACKYGKPPITLTAKLQGRAVKLTVSDKGPGIPPEAARSLFRPFARAAGNTAPGVGLGLHLSRRLARDLKGDLTLSTAAREGCSMVLTLPVE